MNLVLIGYRGTGKSQIGKLVARRTQMPCIRMDEEIEKKAGLAIPDIVGRYGWTHFRDLESAVAGELLGRDHAVIDTGGGVIERAENIEILRRNACVVWLTASVDTIVRRIKGGTKRPSLTPGKTFTEEVAEVLERRTPLYAGACHYRIDTDHMTPAQVADRVLAVWAEYQRSGGPPASA